jgi:hypothetical protein
MSNACAVEQHTPQLEQNLLDVALAGRIQELPEKDVDAEIGNRFVYFVAAFHKGRPRDGFDEKGGRVGVVVIFIVAAVVVLVGLLGDIVGVKGNDGAQRLYRPRGWRFPLPFHLNELL